MIQIEWYPCHVHSLPRRFFLNLILLNQSLFLIFVVELWITETGFGWYTHVLKQQNCLSCDLSYTVPLIMSLHIGIIHKKYALFRVNL